MCKERFVNRYSSVNMSSELQGPRGQSERSFESLSRCFFVSYSRKHLCNGTSPQASQLQLTLGLDRHSYPVKQASTKYYSRH